ncbi:15700_t:CDS:10, partial [Dentiscutata erythropus]
MTEEIEVHSFEEEDAEFFEFKQFNKNALSVQLSQDTTYPEVIPPYPSLLAISKIYGYFVAATNKGFIYAYTQDLHKLFGNSEAGSKELLSQKIHFEIPEGNVRCLRLSSDQLTLVVGVEGGLVFFYDVTKFASEQAGSQPFQIMSFPDDVRDLRPNPGEKHNLIAILLASGIIYIKDYLLNNEISKLEGSKVGERFTAKNALFVVAYFPVIQEEEAEHEVFIVSREIKSKILYIKCPTICCPSLFDHPKLPYLYMETIKDWGSNLKCLIICASANSADVSLIVRDSSNNWTSLILTETNRAALPLSEIHGNDTLPIGLALDFTCIESWITRLTADENTEIPPVPILYILNDECDIVAYRCFNKDAFLANESLSEMTHPKKLPDTGHSSGMIPPKRDLLPPTTNTQDSTAFPPIDAPNKTESPISPPSKTGSSVVDPIKTASPIVVPLKTASPIVAPIRTASPVVAPIKTASPIVVPNKTSSPIIVPTKTDSFNNSLASSVSSNKYIPSQKNITTPPPDSTPPRNLGSNQPTESDSKTPHMIRMNATNNDINQLNNLIEVVGNSYIAKYHNRTTEQCFDNSDTWSIGDLPVITSEINRLEHEASSMSQALADLRRQVNEFSHDVHIDYVKTTKDIEHLMYTPSNMITIGRRGILQSRIKERLETTFKTVKESAQALEAQLNALHEQIQEKKSNKSLRQYIDRSIRNISKGLYRNASQIEQLSAQLDQLTLQISSGDHASNREASVSTPIIKVEPIKAPTKNISYSIDAAEATAAYLNKERICERLKTINKFNRKSPVKTSVFEENEDEFTEKKFMTPIIISPKKSPSSLKPRTFPRAFSPRLGKQVLEERSTRLYQVENIDYGTEKYQDYEDSRPFIHDDIYTLPENLGIQETMQATEVAQSVRFQSTGLELPLSFGEKLVESPLPYALESDESNLTRASLISQYNETTQEQSIFEATSSYQDRDEEAQYLDSYRDETQDSDESKFGKIIESDVSRLLKTSELKQSFNNFEEESKSSVPQTVPNTTTEDIIAENGNELMGVSENFGSFGLGEPAKTFNASGSQSGFGLFGDRSLADTPVSTAGFGKPTSFGAATSAPIVFGAGLPVSNNASGIPPAFATPPSNVNTFSSLAAHPSQAFGQPAFGQIGFGQSSLGASNTQAFGQPAFGQPAFGQSGFGQARMFGTPAALSANVRPPSGSGFARFASNNAFGNVNDGNDILGASGNSFGATNTPANTNKSSFMEFR